MIAATSGSSYDSRSITWHQWHHTAPMSRRIGLSSALAFRNASSPHGCQSTGWWAALRRYEERSPASRFSPMHANEPQIGYLLLGGGPPKDIRRHVEEATDLRAANRRRRTHGEPPPAEAKRLDEAPCRVPRRARPRERPFLMGGRRRQLHLRAGGRRPH